MSQPKPARSYLIESQEILIRLLTTMVNRFPEPSSVQELADDISASRDQTYRTLHTLNAYGWIRKSGENWVVDTRFGALSQRMLATLDHLKSEVTRRQ